MIIINGAVDAVDVNLAAVNFISGAIEFETESSFVAWMHQIYNAIRDGCQEIIDSLGDYAFLIIEAIKGDTGTADDFNSDLEDSVGELEDVQDVKCFVKSNCDPMDPDCTPVQQAI